MKFSKLVNESDGNNICSFFQCALMGGVPGNKLIKGRVFLVEELEKNHTFKITFT